jgi:hypothetical protein
LISVLTVVFEYNTCRLILHSQAGPPLELTIAQPYLFNSSTTPLTATVPKHDLEARSGPRCTASVSLELVHRRLGHMVTQTVLAAHDAGIWPDLRIVPDVDPMCVTCKLSSIQRTAHSSSPVAHATSPGQILFMDIVSNTSPIGGLTSRTHFSHYLLTVDAFY